MHLKRLVSVMIVFVYVLMMILGTQIVSSIAFAADSTTENNTAAYLRDRETYLDFLNSGKWRDVLNAEVSDSYLTEPEISATAMVDVDRDGVFELWFEAIEMDGFFPMGVSALMSITDGKNVKVVLVGEESGGSIGGTRIGFFRDLESGKDVPALMGHAGGFGGYASSNSFYEYKDLNINKILTYEKLTISKEDVSSDDFFYEDLDDSSMAVIYSVNNEQVRKEAFWEAEERFNTEAVNNAYQLTEVQSGNLIPIPSALPATGNSGSAAISADPAIQQPAAINNANAASNNRTALFSDISGHWASKEIETLTLNGFINGVSDSTFEPEANVTREQLIKLVVTTLGHDHYYYQGDTVPFYDVSESDWSYSFIYDALQAEIIDSGSSFSPAAFADRETCALWIAKGLGLNISSRSTRFGDHSSFTYPGAVAAVVDAGIINGFEDNTFRPRENLTRAQAAAMLNRSFNYLLAHQTDGQDFEMLKSSNTDLNGDGIDEKIALYAEILETNYDDTIEGYYYIEVNGKRGPRVYADGGIPELFVEDLDNNDPFKELAFSQMGPSLDYCTDFYRYTGEDFYLMGSASSVVQFPSSWEKGHNGSSESAIIMFNRDGTMHCTMRATFVQTWEMPVEFVVTDKGRVEWKAQDVYQMTPNEVTVIEDIPNSGDAAHPGISFKAGEKFTFLETDLKEWVKIKSETGKEGWIRLAGDAKWDFAYEYLEDVVVYD